MLSPNVVIPFVGTHAGIPTGFTRETSLDGRYAKGWSDATPPGTAGGAETHTHASAAHNHAPTPHTHSVVLSQRRTNPDGIGQSPGPDGMKEWHFHRGVSDTTTGGTNETPTWGAMSNDPPYYTVIYIKANGYQLIPQNGMVYRSSTTRSGMSIHTPSDGKYHKGAATGANAGSTGGSYQNTHTINHTHASYHSHKGRTNVTEGDDSTSAGTTGSAAPRAHQHNFDLFDVSITLNENAPASFTGLSELTTNIEPAHRTLNAFYAAGGSAVPLKDDICIWTGSTASVPLGWKLCNGTNNTVDLRDKFIKVPTGAPLASTTGGRNTHAHIGVSHAHTNTAAHTHTGNHDFSNDCNQVGTGNNGYRQFCNHKHDDPYPPMASISTSNVSFGSATFTPNAADNQPLFTTVAYIQFIYSTVGGSFLFNLL